MYKPGTLVRIRWEKSFSKKLGLDGFDISDWVGEELIEQVEFRDGKQYLWLKGRHCCPVRVERVVAVVAPQALEVNIS